MEDGGERERAPSTSQSRRAFTVDMLYFNNFEAGCTRFPDAGTNLCMPHKCDVYTVNENLLRHHRVIQQHIYYVSIQWNGDINWVVAISKCLLVTEFVLAFLAMLSDRTHLTW